MIEFFNLLDSLLIGYLEILLLLIEQPLINLILRCSLPQRFEYLHQHIRERMRAHVLGGAAKHDEGRLDQKVLEDLIVQQAGVLVLLLEMRVDSLDGIVGLSDGYKLVQAVVSEHFPDVGRLHEVRGLGDVVEELDVVGPQLAPVVVVVDLEHWRILLEGYLHAFHISFLLLGWVVESQRVQVVELFLLQLSLLALELI